MMASVLAHGIGVRGDLPLPLPVVAYGAIGVLVVSFLLLARLWPSARLEPQAPREWRLPAGLSRGLLALEWPLRVLGVVAFVGVLLIALTVDAAYPDNIAPSMLYLTVWVVITLVSAFVGNVWWALNPFETLARLLDRDDEPAWLERVGWWPAAGTLLAFTWVELVHPDPADPQVVGMFLAGYAVVLLAGGVVWGGGFVRRADGFGAFFRVVSAMAPVHRQADGRLALRWPVVGLAQLPIRPGLAALVLVALGSTTYDGLSRTSLWESWQGPRVGWATVPLGTVGLLGSIAVVAGLYLYAVHDAAQRTGVSDAGTLAERFAPSLVPIALAYAIAHYFSLVVFEGQLLLKALSDPLDTGANLLGTSGWTLDYTAVSTTTIAVVQVAAVVLGHVAGVVLAHDRAVAQFPRETASESQYAMLVAMVAYTVGALLLLLGA